MKRFLLAALTTTAALVLFAQGNDTISNGNRRYTRAYDLKTVPPVTLSEAYPLALSYLGTATNRFYCVSASCLGKTERGLPGWTFSFSNTNGERASVEVSFDREVHADNGMEQLLRAK